eukprot:m.315481 g.315481  ORF g.315481 m.315481 type:complete len:83 (+) comp41941_c0_seq1:166-414(+)
MYQSLQESQHLDGSVDSSAFPQEGGESVAAADPLEFDHDVDAGADAPASDNSADDSVFFADAALGVSESNAAGGTGETTSFF